MSSLPVNGKAPSLTFLLLWASYTYVASCIEDAAVPELSPGEYFSTLPRSKASLVYFRKEASPSTEVFLEQLENSIEALQDYGISVLKVNCHKEGEGLGYCREDSSLGKAYLFRGHVLLRELPTDALFSVDAIVANVLFALLFNEVKYLRTLKDLQNLEDSLKGQSDLAFAYVQAIGTAEHRVVMEAAFVYGSVKFALTTEVTLLRSIRSEEPDIPSSQLFFCHCKVNADPSQPCQRTRMEQLLTTLNVHKFLKLMGEPLMVEVAGDPEKISTVHTHLGLPLIFILTREETLEADKRTAESVAWRLLGKAGVLLLSRNSVGLNVLPQHNVAIKTAEEGVPVRYLVLKDTDEIVTLVEGDTQSEPIQSFQEEYEEEEEEEDNEQEIQDDQVVESIIRDRKHELSLENIRTLTEESFGSALTEANHTVVLFYASWEAVSLVVMHAYADVAAHLNGSPEISLARVNCWDWPQVCAQQNVTQFPALKVFTKEQRWLSYSGMWETQEMLRFIEVSRISCPVKLMTPTEVEEYLSFKILPYNHVVVLGLFDSSMKEAREAFTEAARVLEGYVTTAIYYEEDAAPVSHKYNVHLPGLLFAKPETQKRSIVHLSDYSTSDIVKTIRHLLLETFPEITVGNLPEFFQLEKPLLILFSDGALSERNEGEMRRLAAEETSTTFIACWLNLKNTPVGRGILKTYFGSSLPPLPLLLWISLHSGAEVFAFPSDQSFSQANVQTWIKKLKSGQEIPSAVLSDEDWKPRLPAYDFLSKMAPTLPEFTIYSGGSIHNGPEEEVEALGGKNAGAAVSKESTEGTAQEAEGEKELLVGGDLRGTAPRLAAREKQSKRHMEL
ncbi:thioredoxin domain-containing protein 16 [Sceloporus undulatus]|uniref:thioredoxin domain-containing protein 16 n=1 Tax=Sceloporus undulatus TaxID=8520 RepID=UPI001C4B8DAE|nr:thioredoxin domain-containing protein 16 [Sceloporus undulatus]XP_042335805.1 thioredoxin domain-containing protein 16 [Sceloporus undulatus]